MLSHSDRKWELFDFNQLLLLYFTYLANAVEALTLTELVFDLSGTLFGLFQAAHSIRVLTVTEADVAEVKVCTVEILQQLALSLQDE